MQIVDTDKPDNLIARNNRVSVYRPSVTNELKNVRPSKYRNVETARVDQENLKTTKLNNESSSRQRKINRSEVVKDMVNRKIPSQSDIAQKTNGRSQKPLQSNSVTSPKNSQSYGFDSNPGKINNGNGMTGNKKSSNKATKESKPIRSSSSRTRNN